MKNEKLKEELLKKRSWLVAEAIELIRSCKGDDGAETFIESYRKYTEDPFDSFYDSNVLATFVDDIEEEEEDES